MLLVIIVILAAAIGFMVLKPMHAKEPTKIKVKSQVQVAILQNLYTMDILYHIEGVRGVYSKSGEFFVDPTQDPNYKTF